MNRTLVVAAVVTLVFVLIIFSALTYWSNSDYSSKTKHETSRWAAIVDSKNDVISVETSDNNVWETIKSLHQNQTEMWIGGVLEEYDNYWGFRFRPDSIVIAEITIEGAQANIKAVSEDLNYWMNTWAKQVYVFAKVSEINE
ncbi:MAG: hypothetical protein NWF03_05415 [Candidatus Bathyarchaeota archaeon]|nr:hypothetical protein [Candidatus Bathyarchaeota archaeon]